jgi:hypothetical protein
VQLAGSCECLAYPERAFPAPGRAVQVDKNRSVFDAHAARQFNDPHGKIRIGRPTATPWIAEGRQRCQTHAKS